MHAYENTAGADSQWSRRGQDVGKRGSGVDHDFYAMHPVAIGDRNHIGDSKLGMDCMRLGIGAQAVPNLSDAAISLP
jgi:hypothetical protein